MKTAGKEQINTISIDKICARCKRSFFYNEHYSDNLYCYYCLEFNNLKKRNKGLEAENKALREKIEKLKEKKEAQYQTEREIFDILFTT